MLVAGGFVNLRYLYHKRIPTEDSKSEARTFLFLRRVTFQFGSFLLWCGLSSSAAMSLMLGFDFVCHSAAIAWLVSAAIVYGTLTLPSPRAHHRITMIRLCESTEYDKTFENPGVPEKNRKTKLQRRTMEKTVVEGCRAESAVAMSERLWFMQPQRKSYT